MPITDLTNTTWIINETPNINPPRMYLQHINYISNNVEFTQMYIGYIPELDYENNIWYTGFSSVQAYSSPNWSNQSYRTITITGGTDATNTTFISWLEANATQQETPTFSNSIFMGDNNIVGVYVGESDVETMYLGDEKIYEKPAPTPSGYTIQLIAQKEGEFGNGSTIYGYTDNTKTTQLLFVNAGASVVLDQYGGNTITSLSNTASIYLYNPDEEQSGYKIGSSGQKTWINGGTGVTLTFDSDTTLYLITLGKD